MTTIRPPSGPSFPEKKSNPIFPPTMTHTNTNGASAPSNASTPSSLRHPFPTNPPLFPPTMRPSFPQQPVLPPTNNYNGQASSTPPPMNPQYSNSNRPMAPAFNSNASSTPPPLNPSSSMFNSKTAPTPPPPMIPNSNASNIPPATTPSTMFQPNTVFTVPPSAAHSAMFRSGATNTPPPPPFASSTMLQSNVSSTPPPSATHPAILSTNTSNTPPPFGYPPLASGHSAMLNTNAAHTPPPPSASHHPPMPPSNMPHPTSGFTYPAMINSNMVNAPPPPPPSAAGHPPPFPNHSIASPRPMYPSPASLYRPPAPSQPTPLIPQTTDRHIYPSTAPPAGPPLSAYPPSQFSNNSMPPASGPTGQPMPYPMAGMPPAANGQQNTNINGPYANNDMVDLLKEKTVVSPFVEEPPLSPLLNDENQQMNCSPEVMRCSLNVIPQTKDLLNKSRLPLGILIHPFKDLESLSVIQGNKIVRCDSCKSYINPFVNFLDNTRWRCSVCFRVNDLPQEFLFDPITKSYGDPSRRPEVRFGTVEYTATADYMPRPPQPAMYLFLLDVSHNAVQTGYLQSFCDILLESLSLLPGDARMQVGFLTYDSRLHFYDLSDRHNGSFRVMILPDLDNKPEDYLPLPDGLMVTLCECRTTVESFLNELPKLYQDNDETDSALGAALLIAQKLLNQTGGRVTVFQTRIPNINPGALNEQIVIAGQSVKEPTAIGPTSDYYKKLSLEYATAQIACDLFLLNSHYVDLATLSGISKYSGGEVKYYPGYHSLQKPHEVERFENDLRRYLQRKIGFEAVMRLRTPPALAVHTFHGSGFVRSVDLLVLPNVNPDAAFGMQISIEDSLAHQTTATFQAAVLYTSSKGERRIRVHTLSLPVSGNLLEICSNADQEAVASLIAKMAADRSMTASLNEAREAMSNVACDVLRACSSQNQSNRGFSLMVPYSLRLLPLHMLSMIKSTAFRAGSATRLDDRAYYIDLCKTMPIQYLMQIFYPDLYPIHTIEDKSQIVQDGEDELHIPQRSHLSFQHIDSHGAYILDTSEYIYIYIGKAISDHFVQNVFNVPTFSSLPLDSYSLPEFENPLSMKIHNFLSYLIQSRAHGVAIHIMREDSSHRHLFTRYLVDDKSESTMSYVEFLRYIREQIAK